MVYEIRPIPPNSVLSGPVSSAFSQQILIMMLFSLRTFAFFYDGHFLKNCFKCTLMYHHVAVVTLKMPFVVVVVCILKMHS